MLPYIREASVIGFLMKIIPSLKGRNRMTKQRGAWVTDDPIYIEYHDDEWGNLDRFQDDHYLFEMLTLEGAQAGLSWLTILKRRKAYREAFNRFDPELVAKYDEETIQTLLQNKGIIRNE